MKKSVQDLFDLTLERYPALAVNQKEILKAYEAIVSCYQKGGEVMVCGNGGSSADSEHIVGELMKGFLRKRPLSHALKVALEEADPVAGEYLALKLQSPLAAISMTAHAGLTSAMSNDVDASVTFAQQVLAYGKKGDVLIALSTSGNAANVYNAAVVARALGVTVIGMTGENGGRLATMCDIPIKVASSETYMVQELHLPIYHALCGMVEMHFFDE